MKPDHLPAFLMPLQLLHIYVIFPPTCLQRNYKRQWSGLGMSFYKMHSNLSLPFVFRFLCDSWDESLCLLLFGHQSRTPLQIWLILNGGGQWRTMKKIGWLCHSRLLAFCTYYHSHIFIHGRLPRSCIFCVKRTVSTLRCRDFPLFHVRFRCLLVVLGDKNGKMNL